MTKRIIVDDVKELSRIAPWVVMTQPAIYIFEQEIVDFLDKAGIPYRIEERA